MKTYFIQTYGCQMNVHESEKLAGVLNKLGYTLSNDISKADIAIFNTCCIREGVETKITAHIGALKKAKALNPNMIIAVGGCMTEQEDSTNKIMAKFPFVDIVFGTNNLFRFKELLEQKLSGTKRIKEIKYKDNVPEDEEIHRTSGENAYVNIIYGCNNFCTYCIVPYVRGRERSRNPENIVKEVKELIKTGNYKTITLLGQNVNSYGKDLKNKTTFSQLLAEICKIEGNYTLRFLTSHPKDFSDDLINVISKENKISKEIHLPVQSGSSKILKAMNRNYTRVHYLKLIQKIRKSIPNCRITTDIIVGFPGETEKDFMQTVDLIKKVKYNAIFAFMYSKRKGTLAEKMEQQVPIEEKRRRVNYILSLEKEIQKQLKGN